MSVKFKEYLFYICAVLLLLSAVLYMTGWPFIPYVYAIGTSGVAIVYLTNRYKGDNIRLKRLYIQEVIAAILLPISSYLMFHNKNEWFVFLSVSAFLQLYIAFVKSKEEKKEIQQ